LEVEAVMTRTPVVLAAVLALPILAAAAGPEWSWRESSVNGGGDYVELRYGSQDADPRSWIPAARFGPPKGRVFPVAWLVDPRRPENRDLVEAIERDLDYYLKDAGRPDPWSYAPYHCGTMSNWYGDVHWLCVEGQRRALRAAGERKARAERSPGTARRCWPRVLGGGA
jgi:hypothetical protein